MVLTNLKYTFQLAVIPRRNAAAEAVQLNTPPIFPAIQWLCVHQFGDFAPNGTLVASQLWTEPAARIIAITPALAVAASIHPSFEVS